MRQGITEFQEPPTGIGLTEDTTVNLVATDTATEIQALIDAQPKNLNGYSLTFQFADGTYTLDTQLNFAGFTGGVVQIWGKTGTDNTLSTTKAVHLDFSVDTGIRIDDCSAVDVRSLKVDCVLGDLTGLVDILNAGAVDVYFCYLLSDGITNGYGVRFDHVGNGSVFDTYVTQTKYAIGAYNSRVFSRNNDDSGTQPAYGIRGLEGSTIAKYNSAQISGSTADEIVSQGAIIR